ncbi:hypothetical protein COOONC_17447 [Cooperia oncophora]
MSNDKAKPRNDDEGGKKNLTRSSEQNITDMTLNDFKSAVPQIGWRDLLGAELSPILKLTDETMVSVMNLEYFKPSRRYCPSLVTHFQTMANYLCSCAENLESFEPAQKLYIANNRLGKKDKSSFLGELKKDFLTNHLSYPSPNMDDFNRIAFLVGYPQRLTNEELVWKPFSSVATDFNDYFGTITRLLRRQSIYRLSQIGTYLDSDDATVYDVLRPTLEYNGHLAIMGSPFSAILFVPAEAAAEPSSRCVCTACFQGPRRLWNLPYTCDICLFVYSISL